MNKPKDQEPLAVVGAGSWGTALAQVLAQNNRPVRLWAYEPEVALQINQQHSNPIFLPDIELSPNITASDKLGQVLEGTAMVALVMPSHVFRKVLSQAAAHLAEGTIVVCCAKGIEESTGYTMVEVAGDVLPKAFHRRLACLSGPSFAREVARAQPTAVTVASQNLAVAQEVQKVFASPVFRVYTSPDPVGVEIGGATKNPLAIAAGMCAGLGLGANTLAALITRGLAEMTRLALALGGQQATLSGLAGLGDLVLTCNSEQSRNFTVGKRLAKGEGIDQITSSMKMVAEGVINTKTILDLAKKASVEMPITKAVFQVIYQGKAPQESLHELMTRGLKAEFPTKD